MYDALTYRGRVDLIKCEEVVADFMPPEALRLSMLSGRALGDSWPGRMAGMEAAGVEMEGNPLNWEAFPGHGL